MKYNPFKTVLAVATTVLALQIPAVRAANVTLTTNDASGASSFAAAGHWSNGQAPSPTNTYQSAFTLRVAATATFQGASLEILSGGDLRIKNSGTAATINNFILDNGSIVDLGTSGSASLSGNVSLPSGQACIGGGTSGGGLLTVNSVISGAGGLITSQALLSGPGTNIFTGSNTYSGATTIPNSATNAVALQLGNVNAVRNSTVTVSLANGLKFSTGIGTFNIGALAGSVADTLADTGGTAVTLSVGGNNASTTYSGALGGSGALTKTGTGTLTLSAANTYAGATTVSAGTLLLNASGSLAAGSSVNIAAGATFDVSAQAAYTLGSSATLSASGAASAATIKGGSTVSLGSRPVTLTYDGSHAALTLSTGTLQLNNNTFTVVVPGTALGAGTYTLVSTPGAISGTPNPTPSFAGGNGIAGGDTGTVSVSGNNVILTVTAGGGSGSIVLANSSFETNTSGTVFANKVTTGYDVAGTNNVAGWLNAGSTYADSGVDFAGDHSVTAQSGTVVAYCKAGDSGAYQISGHPMQSGEQLTLTWWAKSSGGSASQTVSLLSGASTSSTFSSLTTLAVSTAALSNTGNGGAYTQYTLNYTATAADAGRFVAVSFLTTGPAASKWAMFDTFALSFVAGGGGPGPVSATHSTISPATASVPATGTNTLVITVQARDATNINETNGGATVVFSLSGGGAISGTTDNGNGTYTATLTAPTNSGSATVTATLNGTSVGTAVGASQCAVTYTATGGIVSAANSTISPGLTSLTANGGSTQVITVQARDASNNNVATGGATVVVSRSSGTGTISATTDNHNGTYVATLTAPTSVGNGTFTATLNGVAVGTAVGASPCAATYYSTNFGDALTGLTASQVTNFNVGSVAFNKVQTVASGLGPIFNNSGCANCHNFPVSGGSGSATVTRFGLNTNGVFNPLTSLGGSLLQDNSNTTNFETVPISANVTAKRETQPCFGLGLIEAIADSTIQSNAVVTNVDGIVGTVSLVIDPVDGKQHVGRFGWKAQQATLLGFSADAANNEVGITSRILPVGQAPNGNTNLYNQLNTVADPNDVIDISGKADIDRDADFQRFLAPPPTLPLTANAVSGKALFSQIHCDICHTPSLPTSPAFIPVSDLALVTNTVITALSSKSVPLYSDLLLHNMGALADGIAQAAATTNQMRTAPLWGLRQSLPYLHDGRALTVDAAIRAHAGDAALSATRYINLSTNQQSQLVEFLNSL
jgi:autotransporter-associated beta strand protein